MSCANAQKQVKTKRLVKYPQPLVQRDSGIFLARVCAPCAMRVCEELDSVRRYLRSHRLYGGDIVCLAFGGLFLEGALVSL